MAEDRKVLLSSSFYEETRKADQILKDLAERTGDSRVYGVVLRGGDSWRRVLCYFEDRKKAEDYALKLNESLKSLYAFVEEAILYKTDHS